jgi:ABC-2 type transport system ATP-binding protein
LLTTQYLEEADRLCDRIAVVDAGRIVAEGTATELKRQIGGVRLEVTLLPGAAPESVLSSLGDLVSGAPRIAAGRVSVPVAEGYRSLVEVVRRFDAAGIEVADVAMHQPSLDDVFLTLTGKSASPADAGRAA